MTIDDLKKISVTDPEILFLTFFGVGLVPIMPGTLASLLTLPFLYGFGLFSPPFFIFIPLVLILTATSTFIAHSVQKRYVVHDPSWIVIDEVIGMLVTWLFSPTAHWPSLFLMFLYFRFFDIVKVWPANYFDKKVKHGFGTIFDDILSGAYAGLLFLLTKHFLPTLNL